MRELGPFNLGRLRVLSNSFENSGSSGPLPFGPFRAPEVLRLLAEGKG